MAPYAAFNRIADRFRRDGATAKVFARAVDELTRDAMRFPEDSELLAAIKSNPAYRWIGSNRLQDILWELDQASRSSLAEKIALPEDLSVEHVLPQRWNAAWPFSDGSVSSYDAGTAAVQRRNTLIDTLGNLTLVTGGLNSSLGNAGFKDKRTKLEAHSYLALNS